MGTNTTFKQKAIDLAERVVATFLSYLFANLVVNVQGPPTNWVRALDVAGFATATCVLTTIVFVWLGGLHLRNPWVDMLVRAVLTYLQGIVGWAATAGVTDFVGMNWKVANAVAFAAVIPILAKSLAGKAMATTAGASIVVTKPVAPKGSFVNKGAA